VAAVDDHRPPLQKSTIPLMPAARGNPHESRHEVRADGGHRPPLQKPNTSVVR